MYYRGYILIRLKEIGMEWKVVDILEGLKSTELEEDWKITYATPLYGAWDVIVECSFNKLKDLDKIEIKSFGSTIVKTIENKHVSSVRDKLVS